jgi:cytochrome oxidase Cu insertion factor (SCO1/SenC/PrrC family)
MEGFMRGQASSLARQTLAIISGVLFFSPFLANPTSGREIKLPPLRVRIGEKAPDFTLPSAIGKTFQLSKLRGHNILIDFYRGYW